MFASRVVSVAKAARPLFTRAAAFPKVAVLSNVRYNATLAETLHKELKHEQVDEEVDQEFVDIHKMVAKSFKIQDNAGEGIVRLTREHKGETVHVLFDCQDVEENEIESDTEGEDPEVDVGVNFEVVISKPAANSKMVFQCMGTAEGTTIQNVRHLPLDKDVDDVDGYTGPTFDDLDEDLQNGIASFLETRKIDSDFGYFVLAYATDKEQREYVNWLNKFHEFVVAK